MSAWIEHQNVKLGLTRPRGATACWFPGKRSDGRAVASSGQQPSADETAFDLRVKQRPGLGPQHPRRVSAAPKATAVMMTRAAHTILFFRQQQA